MDSLEFETLFAALRGLALHDKEREQLRTWLGRADDVDACIALIERAAAGKCCPRCGGARSHRCGHASGLQRWRCLACGRSYNALTGTKLARLRKKACWLPYLRCLLESRTVRASAEAVQVHRTTSFRWRHRMVSGFMRERPAPLAGVVEADETYLLESQKGSRTLTRPARRRGGVASHRSIGRDHDCLLVACARGGASARRRTAGFSLRPRSSQQRAARGMPGTGSGARLPLDQRWGGRLSCLRQAKQYRP